MSTENPPSDDTEVLIQPENRNQSFYNDLSDSIVIFIGVVLISIHSIAAYAIFCNSFQSKTHRLLSVDPMIFLKNLSYLLIVCLIIVTYRLIQSSSSTRISNLRNSIVLYLIIVPMTAVYGLTILLETYIYFRKINCNGFLFSFLGIFVAGFTFFTLKVLNDIDRLFVGQAGVFRQILRKSILLLIVVSCFGIYFYEMSIRLITSKTAIFVYMNYTVEYCKILKNESRIYDIFNIYNKSVSFSSVGYAICLLFYVIPLLKLIRSRHSIDNNQQSQELTNRNSPNKEISVLSIIVVMILICIGILAFLFEKFDFSTDKQFQSFGNEIISVKYAFLILSHACVVGLSIFIIRGLAMSQKFPYKYSQSMTNQCFAWGGLFGNFLNFICNVILFSLSSHSYLIIANAFIRIVSVSFQTFLIDLLARRSYKRRRMYSWTDGIQPFVLLSGFNIYFVLCEIKEVLLKNDITDISDLGYWTFIMRIFLTNFSYDLIFLQQLHAIAYFMHLFNKN